MKKSRDAYRTISEVEELLNTPAHVLRYWESKFPQIAPVKRAGNRRYYRPSDIDLIAGIKKLLHDEGFTIRGAQKILHEKGVPHVTSLIASPLETENKAARSGAEVAKLEHTLQKADESRSEKRSKKHTLTTLSAFGEVLHISSRTVANLDPERRKSLISLHERLCEIRDHLSAELSGASS